jgi:uncharacterized protein
MSAEGWYLDSSAVARLVLDEPESPALLRWQRRKLLASSDLVRVEVVRATRLWKPEAEAKARRVIRALMLLRIDPGVCERAALLDPPHLRSLDALHLAAALSLGADLAGIVTYDLRMAAGAEALGIAVEAPA